MKLLTITLAGTALLALAGCDQLGMGGNANTTANAADNTAVTNEAAPPADANAAKPADAAAAVNEVAPTADPAAAGDKPAEGGDQPEPAAGDKPE